MSPLTVRRIRAFSDTVVLLLIVAIAAALIFALHHATHSSGNGTGQSFAIALDDATGVKARSFVLFKGIPVGTVSEVVFDPKLQKVLVRIDLNRGTELPAHIQPYLKTPIVGDVSIGLDIARPDDPGFAVDLTAELAKGRHNLAELPVVEGVSLSRADSILPGISEKIEEAVRTAKDAAFQAGALATTSKDVVGHLSEDVSVIINDPLRRSIEAIQNIVDGPEGDLEEEVCVPMRKILEELKAHSDSLHILFKGTADKEGLLKLVATLNETSTSLKKAGDTIAGSKKQLQKFGEASAQFGEVSRVATSVARTLDERPQALIFGLSREQKEHRAKEMAKPGAR